MADEVCTYYAIPRCGGKAVGELRAHNLREHGPWPLCETHLQPSAHPPDLRDKLVRYETAGAGTDGDH